MATSKEMHAALEELAKRMGPHAARAGAHSIRLELAGAGGGVWSLDVEEGAVRLSEGGGSAEPTAVVTADAEAIGAVLAGEKDGRAAFLAGGIRVRGDIASLEQLSAALGTHRPSGEGHAGG